MREGQSSERHVTEEADTQHGAERVGRPMGRKEGRRRGEWERDGEG